MLLLLLLEQINLHKRLGLGMQVRFVFYFISILEHKCASKCCSLLANIAKPDDYIRIKRKERNNE